MRNKLVAGMVFAALVLVFVPRVSSAAFFQEIYTRILELQKQVEDLKAQLTTAQQGVTQQWCHDFNVNLKFENESEEIGNLHIALKKEGFDIPETQAAPGQYFSEQTAAAVTGFQEKYRDEILMPNSLKYGTGFVGPSTRAKLNQLYGCKGTAVPPTATTPVVINPPITSPVTPTPATPTSPTVSNPLITVLSPNGGETWSFGQPQIIKWSSRDVTLSDISVYLHFPDGALCYLGNANVNSGSFAFTLQNGQDCKAIVRTLSAGQYTVALYAGDPTEPATFQAKDDSDAFFSIVAAGTDLPDLVISDFSWTPNSPKSGENIAVNVKVKNVGSASAQNFSVTNLWDSNGKEINISSLAPGGEITVQGTIGGLSIPGPNVVTMSVDVPSKVTESNENNNSLNKTINVSPNYSGDGLATLKHWETWQLNNGYILYADGANVLGQTPYKVRFEIYDPKTNYQVIATSPDLIIGNSWSWSSSNQNINIKVNAINVSSPGNTNWSVNLNASSAQVATPSITVLSPNGGDVWYPGETHAIRWNNNNIGKNAVYIYIYDSNISGSGSTNYITPSNQSVSGTQTATGSVGDSVGAYYNWTIPPLNQLPGGGSKNYRIRIYNASNPTISDASDAPFSIVAAQTVSAPAAPTIVSAEAYYGGVYKLTWKDNSSNRDGFKFERREGTNGSWTPIGTLPAYASSGSFGNVIPNVNYTFRMRAYNTAGESDYSNEISVGLTVYAPAAPTGLNATAISSSQINLSWKDNASNENNYTVEYKQGNTGNWATLTSNLAVNSTAYSANQLEAGATYFFRVKATNVGGSSGYSNEVIVSTPLILGDVDENGKVDVNDSLFIAQYVEGKRIFTSAQLITADVNKDGKVSTNDAKIVSLYDVGKFTSFPVNVKVGDIDKSGKITSGDALLVTQYLAGTKTFDAIQEAAADVNNDNQITKADADAILSASVGVIKELPIPYVTPATTSQNNTSLNQMASVLQSIQDTINQMLKSLEK